MCKKSTSSIGGSAMTEVVGNDCACNMSPRGDREVTAGLAWLGVKQLQ